MQNMIRYDRIIATHDIVLFFFFVLLFLLGRVCRHSSKKPKEGSVVSNRIGMKFGRIRTYRPYRKVEIPAPADSN